MTKCVRHPEHEAGTTCRICKTECCDHCSHGSLGICHQCGYKILIGIVVVMVVISYAAWFGVF